MRTAHFENAIKERPHKQHGFMPMVFCVLLMAMTNASHAAEFSLSKLFSSSPRELSALGFEAIGTLPESMPWLNYERIGWLYSAHTGKVPNYAEYIMNGEYLEKGARQMPQFCQLNRLRFAVCEFMRTSHPKFLADYKAIATEGIEAAKTQNEFFMAGAVFPRVNSYDMATGGIRIVFEGVSGGIVIGSGCWFSHIPEAPHACINIDNIKAVNKSVLPVPQDLKLTEKLVENSGRGEYFLVMKVRIRTPFSSSVMYKRGNYMMGGSTELYTAWVVATNIYLVDKDGNVYYDISTPNDSSEKDRIDADIRKRQQADAVFDSRPSRDARSGRKIIQVNLGNMKATSTPPDASYTSIINTLCRRYKDGEIAATDHIFLFGGCKKGDGTNYGEAPLTQKEVVALRTQCEKLATQLSFPRLAREYEALACK